MKEENTYERTEYPRPNFKRNSWMNLNGIWNFDFDDLNEGEKNQWFTHSVLNKEIKVPFTYESKASGMEETVFHPHIWYQRTFTLPKKEAGKTVILRFQASDYITKVWINGTYIGDHTGGNAAFSFDITKALSFHSENQITVKAEDSQSCSQPRGKQRWRDHNFGCWYVQSTGIWQTVWLEFIPDSSIQSVKMTPDIDTNSVCFEYTLTGRIDEALTVQTSIRYQEEKVKEFSFSPNQPIEKISTPLLADIHETKIHYWTPDHPHLYDVTFCLYKDGVLLDEVESYIGMRKISIKNGQVLLNNRPIYQKLLLDQGYWKDTLLTPPSDEALLEDIDKTLEMGFNGVRKHQKLEDERFLYWCDKKGLLVWSEMAAAYEFTDQAVANLTKEWLDIVEQHYNHPSIITWVPFNESWGIANILTDKKQKAFTEAVYYLTKSLDGQRPVVVNDGWEHTISDILTLHDYEEWGEALLDRYKDKEKIVNNVMPHNKNKYAFAEGYEYKGQPIIISEYGGIAFNEEDGWGYGSQVNSEEEFFKRYQEITKAIKSLSYIVGFCYTQTTDVQQEINGLLKEDRTPKVSLDKIKEINNVIR